LKTPWRRERGGGATYSFVGVETPGSHDPIFYKEMVGGGVNGGENEQWGVGVSLGHRSKRLRKLGWGSELFEDDKGVE